MCPPPETPHAPVEQIVAGHFREGPGYAAWRSRGTQDWLVVYTCGGRGRFGFDGGELLAEPRDIVLIRPATRHDYGVEQSVRQWELIWAHFRARPDWVQWLAWPEAGPGIARLRLTEDDARGIHEQFARIYQFTLSPERRRLALAMNALEALLLTCDALNPRSQHARVDARIRQAMDHICQHLSQPLTLDDIADAAGLSVSRMAHLFRAQVGTTPQQFLEQQRLHRAAQLLRFTPRSIKEISADVGYDNPFYFSLRFKKQNGRSPRAFRAEGQQPVDINNDPGSPA